MPGFSISFLSYLHVIRGIYCFTQKKPPFFSFSFFFFFFLFLSFAAGYLMSFRNRIHSYTDSLLFITYSEKLFSYFSALLYVCSSFRDVIEFYCFAFVLQHVLRSRLLKINEVVFFLQCK